MLLSVCYSMTIFIGVFVSCSKIAFSNALLYMSVAIIFITYSVNLIVAPLKHCSPNYRRFLMKRWGLYFSMPINKPLCSPIFYIWASLISMLTISCLLPVPKSKSNAASSTYCPLNVSVVIFSLSCIKKSYVWLKFTLIVVWSKFFVIYSL